MCAERDDFGVDEVAKAAYKVACRCGDFGCVLPPQPGEVVRYIQRPSVPKERREEVASEAMSRIEQLVHDQAETKGEDSEPRN